MELTERIAKIVARCTDADAHVIAETLVAELGLVENRHYSSYNSAYIGSHIVSRTFT
jgi:hypothetical protein